LSQPPGPWPSAGPLPPTPLGPWPPGRLGPAHPSPSPSLKRGPRPFIFLLRPLGHEAAATGRPSAAGSPFGCPARLLPLPATDVPPHLFSHSGSPPPSRLQGRNDRPSMPPPLAAVTRRMSSLPRPIKATRSTPGQHCPSSLLPSPLS
jgi:hypothetical protein